MVTKVLILTLLTKFPKLNIFKKGKCIYSENVLKIKTYEVLIHKGIKSQFYPRAEKLSNNVGKAITKFIKMVHL